MAADAIYVRGPSQASAASVNGTYYLPNLTENKDSISRHDRLSRVSVRGPFRWFLPRIVEIKITKQILGQGRACCRQLENASEAFSSLIDRRPRP